MKREGVKRKDTNCCPGHDKWPGNVKETTSRSFTGGTYKTKKSKQARSRDKKREHQMARTRAKRETRRLFEAGE